MKASPAPVLSMAGKSEAGKCRMPSGEHSRQPSPPRVTITVLAPWRSSSEAFSSVLVVPGQISFN